MLVRSLRWIVPAVIASCGGVADTGNASQRPGGPELEQACAAFARTACDRRVVCEIPGGAGQRFVSEGECGERWALACREWVRAPDGKISLRNVGDCTMELAASDCVSIARIAESSPPRLPACLRVSGGRGEGAVCTSDAQCATSFCRYDEAGAICAPAPAEPGYEGEACSVAAPCAQPLRCEGGRCAPGECPETGCFDYHASCGGLDDPGRMCPAGTECVNQSDRGAGQCAPYAREGEACGRYDGPRCLFPARCVRGACALATD